jgi:hypothetical protein
VLVAQVLRPLNTEIMEPQVVIPYLAPLRLMAVDTAARLLETQRLIMLAVQVVQAAAVALDLATQAQERVGLEIPLLLVLHRGQTVAQASTAPAVLHLPVVAVAPPQLVRPRPAQDKAVTAALVRPPAFLVALLLTLVAVAVPVIQLAARAVLAVAVTENLAPQMALLAQLIPAAVVVALVTIQMAQAPQAAQAAPASSS